MGQSKLNLWIKFIARNNDLLDAATINMFKIGLKR